MGTAYSCVGRLSCQDTWSCTNCPKVSGVEVLVSVCLSLLQELSFAAGDVVTVLAAKVRHCVCVRVLA